jgi:hypothetical protein
VKGLFKKAIGKAEATSCHEMDPTIVVMIAPHRPVLKKAWNPSETPKMFSSSSETSIVVTRAMMKKHDTTQHRAVVQS